MTDVTFGLDIPQGRDAALVARFCQRADELDFAGLWCMENVVPHRPQLAPLQLLPFAAALTSRIRLGVAVLVLPRHNPVLLARELAAIDQLSGGRLDVGVGLGRPEPELVPLGFPADRPLRRLSEGVEVMKALWTQESARLDGSIWRVDDVTQLPRPVQRPHPPIWFGVGGPRGLRVAARLGDGWLGAGSSSAEQFLERAARLREELGRVGRAVETFPLGKRVYLSIDPSLESARAALAPVLDAAYAAPGLTDRVAVVGPPEHCAEQVLRLIDGGARHLVFNTLHDPEGQLDAVLDLIDRVRVATRARTRA
jgi:probable F420-dependent oxidoreductase